MKIKVCGLMHFSNIAEVTQSNVDYVGLIFYDKSPRYVNGSLSFDEARQIDPKVKKVGVFVNESIYSVLNIIAHYDLDLVQLHGDEDPEYCNELKGYVPIIKAFGINQKFEFNNLERYKDGVDYFLFDTASETNGGSGKHFDWNLLSKYKMNIPFFLSGGISESDSETIKKLNSKQLYGIDINSKFEIAPGSKDVTRIKQFVKKLK